MALTEFERAVRQHRAAMALHNPFERRDGHLRKAIRPINCVSDAPNRHLIGRKKAVLLHNATDEWLDLISHSGEIIAIRFWKPKFTDLSPIRQMELVHLSLSHGNRINDWSPIGEITSLRHLRVFWTFRFDIELVRHLRNLELLSLGGDVYRPLFVESCESMTALNRLRVLDLAPAQIIHVPPYFLRFIDRLHYFNCSRSIQSKIDRARKHRSLA
jgi:hypothetical protein